jgi:hypothetical protein
MRVIGRVEAGVFAFESLFTFVIDNVETVSGAYAALTEEKDAKRVRI